MTPLAVAAWIAWIAVMARLAARLADPRGFPRLSRRAAARRAAEIRALDPSWHGCLYCPQEFTTDGSGNVSGLGVAFMVGRLADGTIARSEPRYSCSRCGAPIAWTEAAWIADNDWARGQDSVRPHSGPDLTQWGAEARRERGAN